MILKNLDTNFVNEKDFQKLIFENELIKQDIAKLLNIEMTNFKLVKEDEYINKITADFTVLNNNIVSAIIECKGGNIGVTEYVRGIGQIFQYEYFAENGLSKKNYKFCDIKDFKSVYIFPDSVLRINDFNIGLFKYPKSKLIIEINQFSNAVRIITDKELSYLADNKRNNLKAISQYYIRDIRLFEIYFVLKVLSIYKLKNKIVNRKELESNILKKSNSINNSNWRNVFIALSSLGLIDKNNYPTNAGFNLVNMDFPNFALTILKSYINPYIKEIFKVLNENQNQNLSINEIKEKIKENYNNVDVLFLTESDGRYISSWLNIIRDDFGFIKFKARSNDRKIILNYMEYNDEAVIKIIKNHSKYYEFKNKFLEIIDAI